MTSSCAEINARTRHFARTGGDYLPCGHVATRQADGSLACEARPSTVGITQEECPRPDDCINAAHRH